MNEEDINYLTNQMSIDINHLIDKLNSENIISHKDNIIDQIHQYIKMAQNQSKRCNEINELYISIDNTEANMVLSAMHTAIYSFCKEGLLGLWIRQANEAWYPKIIIKEVLEPNDIDDLYNPLTIYRGCDKVEIDNNLYGQAWTTSDSVSEEFAWNHYKDNDWFNSNNRVVLVAKINREDIYYSKQTSHEREIVVNSSKLFNVGFYTKDEDMQYEK